MPDKTWEGFPKFHTRRVVVDLIVQYPLEWTPEYMAGVMRDFMHFNRFVVIPASISVYPPNTRIVQNPIEIPTGPLRDKIQ